jgi:ABC-2 type transport system permease protein
MNWTKLIIIIKREFLTRVRKRSFVVMSILGPFIFAAMIILPIWFSTMEDKEVKVIAVADSSYTIRGLLPETNFIRFHYLEYADIKNVRKILDEDKYWGVLYISPNILNNDPVTLFTYSQANIAITSYLQNAVYKQMIKFRLIKNNVVKIDEILNAINSNVNFKIIKLDKKGTENEEYLGLKMAVGYVCGILIYLFIFLFGTQVMRGVIEEKTNRIIEVIISSVKPFELMLGKIIGIAGVGLSQFIIWIVLTYGIVGVARETLVPQNGKSSTELVLSQDIMSGQKSTLHQQKIAQDVNMNKMESVFESIGHINFGVILGSFVFFFLGGYLLYASLFAAMGSAVDAETDTQQFMLPITVPLILAIYIMINTINNPTSSLSFWFSMIPLTSPIIMMVRIPFGVPDEQVFISAFILIATFLATTWLAGKIYRTGILMYGKKTSYREMWKWIRYKN